MRQIAVSSALVSIEHRFALREGVDYTARLITSPAPLLFVWGECVLSLSRALSLSLSLSRALSLSLSARSPCVSNVSTESRFIL